MITFFKSPLIFTSLDFGKLPFELSDEFKKVSKAIFSVEKVYLKVFSSCKLWILSFMIIEGKETEAFQSFVMILSVIAERKAGEQ
jgi:hypothetical protein